MKRQRVKKAKDQEGQESARTRREALEGEGTAPMEAWTDKEGPPRHETRRGWPPPPQVPQRAERTGWKRQKEKRQKRAAPSEGRQKLELRQEKERDPKEATEAKENQRWRHYRSRSK